MVRQIASYVPAEGAVHPFGWNLHSQRPSPMERGEGGGERGGKCVCEYLCIFSCANESNSVRTAKHTQLPTDTNDNDDNDQLSGSDGGKKL